MSEQTTFTATVESQHAEQLRERRDLTDDDIRADFTQPITKRRLAAERAIETQTRRRWETKAVERAILVVVDDYFTTGAHTTYVDHTRGITGGKVHDLEGVTITVSVTDLVATATLVAPAVD